MCMWLSLYLRSHQKNFKSFRAIFWRCCHFLCLQRKFPKNTKENISSDYFWSHLQQESPINSIPSPDCCIFIAVSENTHNGHISHNNGHMAIWPFDAIMALWPHSHMAIMAFKMDNMGVFGNGKEIAAIWQRNRVD